MSPTPSHTYSLNFQNIVQAIIYRLLSYRSMPPNYINVYRLALFPCRVGPVYTLNGTLSTISYSLQLKFPFKNIDHFKDYLLLSYLSMDRISLMDTFHSQFRTRRHLFSVNTEKICTLWSANWFFQLFERYLCPHRCHMTIQKFTL